MKACSISFEDLWVAKLKPSLAAFCLLFIYARTCQISFLFIFFLATMKVEILSFKLDIYRWPFVGSTHASTILWNIALAFHSSREKSPRHGRNWWNAFILLWTLCLWNIRNQHSCHEMLKLFFRVGRTFSLDSSFGWSASNFFVKLLRWYICILLLSSIFWVLFIWQHWRLEWRNESILMAIRYHSLRKLLCEKSKW